MHMCSFSSSLLALIGRVCFAAQTHAVVAYSEYLAAFQKTVAMHEVFLMRCVSHPVLCKDANLQVFLEYAKDVRSSNHQSVIFKPRLYSCWGVCSWALEVVRGKKRSRAFFHECPRRWTHHLITTRYVVVCCCCCCYSRCW